MYSSTFGINDNMTRVLTGIVRTLNVVISTMQRLDNASDTLGNDAFRLMRSEIAGAEVELKKLDALLTDVGKNSPPTNGISKFQAKIMSLYSMVQLVGMAIRGIGNIGNISDEYVSVNARLSLVNDGLQNQINLQDKVLKSANATRSSYKATADLIAKIGMTGAIKNNDEQISFAEKVNKMLKIGGGTATMNESALLQLSQSLSSGVMQGDEFRSLRENAPALMQNIAKGMGVTSGQLRQLSSDGKLTADVIISAINKMGSSIDEQFNKLPRTFGENKAVFENMVGTWIAKLSQSGGMLGQINDKFTALTNFLASADGVALLENIGFALNIITAMIIGIFDFIGYGIGLLSNMGDISYGLLSTIIVASLLVIIPLLWAKVAALWAMVAPILAQAAAWAIANLPILLVAFAIGVVIGALIRMGISASQVIGFVAGLFGGLVAFLVNIFLFFYNTVMQIVTFFKNIWIDPVFAIQNLFYGMITNVLGFFNSLVNGVIDGLNVIIGAAQKIGASVSTIEHVNFGKGLKAPTSTKAVYTHENKYLDVGDFSSKSSKFAMAKFDKLSTSLDKFSMKNIGSMGGLGSGGTTNMLGDGKNIGDVGKVGKVGSIEKDVKISDEDIKMLYQMAVGDRVNQINLSVETKAPQIISNNNITSNVDFEELYDDFANKLSSEAEISVKSKY